MPATAVEPSRRERKKLATREALHQAALDLVEAEGLANVTVEDITERADVAPRTFFNYFSCKEDAVIGREPDYVARLVDALRARPDGEAGFDSLRRVMADDFGERATQADVLLRRIRVVKSEPHLLSRMAAQFEQLEDGLIAAVADRSGQDPEVDLEPSLLVTLVLAACRVALMHWCDQGGAEPTSTIFEGVFDRLGAGLSPATSCSTRRPTPKGSTR